MKPGPCLYNLFPLLAGPLESWSDHLERIAGMNFDWVYVNPFHCPGASGSLYAIKDFERLHPVVQGQSRSQPDALISGFVRSAAGLGLSVMVDLVINHVSKDALLVDRHPDWFQREPDGGLRSPGALDPTAPGGVVVWDDLAEIDYDSPATQQPLIAYWDALIARYLDWGVAGFRCDAAYQVPPAVWQALITAARRRRVDCVFAAETLGCTPKQVTQLGDCGFDYFFNSAKWWDFKSPWLLDQYALYRRFAPTIAFPESHDTPRLGADMTDAVAAERHARFAYAFCAAFSSGMLMPMGFEYGFRRPLHVVESRPDDWQDESRSPRFDLSPFIAEMNRLKRDYPVLSSEGAHVRTSAPDTLPVVLVRADGGDIRNAQSAAVTVLNPSSSTNCPRLDPSHLVRATHGRFSRMREVTPGAHAATPFADAGLVLKPEDVRIFIFDQPAGQAAGRRPQRRQASRPASGAAAERVAIEAFYPELDGGRFPVKRIVGDVLDVWADIFSDGHDKIAAHVRYRMAGSRLWSTEPLHPVDNDRWNARVPLSRVGRLEYALEAWRDEFASWCSDVEKKILAGQPVGVELEEGRHMVEAAVESATSDDAALLRRVLDRFAAKETGPAAHRAQAAALLDPDTRAAMGRSADRGHVSVSRPTLAVTVDRPAARFSAWYEMFPRSASGDPARHGTFKDVISRLPQIQAMGFDVLYFPPIHPIGVTNRKGRNNSLKAEAGDPGSPYAIGAAAGGHDALHAELGTFDDFADLLAAARDHGLEIALDFAIQCSPDHPWLKDHPEWFAWRPDGTVKFAENPPKKYEDIVNVQFYGDAFPGAWTALRDVVLFWVLKGVRIFRVDNPHTKPFAFWEWLIHDIQGQHSDVIFLAEAFTRPKVMNRLAKLGFTQSYTYFTWRNTKQELTDYVSGLANDETREYFRPNFFVNTPDINPPILQGNNPAAYKMRLVLAATLVGSYGIYSGFEFCEGTPIPGREEYLNSEKYEIRAWNWESAETICDYIARINRIRHENPALHENLNIRFYNAWNDQVLLYGKMSSQKDNFILVAVNLDPDNPQQADFEVPLWEFGLPDTASIAVEDLLSGHRFEWQGKVQQLQLDPRKNPCAIWRIVPPRVAWNGAVTTGGGLHD